MKWLVTLGVIAAAFALWWSGSLQYLSDLDWIREQVENSGWWGPLLFLLLAVILFPFFLAGPLIWLSAAIWPLPAAMLYASVASVVPGVVFFATARWLGKDWAEQRLPDKVREYEGRLARYPVRTIAALRLFLWINPAVDILIGISRISTAHYFLVSSVVLVLSTVMQIAVISVGVDFLLQQPVWLLGAMVAVIALVVVLFLVGSRRQEKA